MQLANEDNLRLNVLLAQSPQAIRINETTMTVHALTAKGEAKIKLHPTSRDEQYLRWVRELLSLKVTGSPGGYPVFMRRWTRMGHTHNNLEQMLLLGEPEAVVAVVYSSQVSHDIARRAWWAYPNAENARRLLEKPDVVTGSLGKELVAYLLEFLPFEEVPLDVVDTVRLCLQGDLISPEEREKLWARAKRKNPFYVGFLHADPTMIPLPQKHHSQYVQIESQLAGLADNPYTQALLKLLHSSGQNWLRTLTLALEKPVDQDVVISLFIAIGYFLSVPMIHERGIRDIQTALQQANDYQDSALTQVRTHLDSAHAPLLHAMLVLAQMGEDTLIPIFGGNDSVGSVMRKRLEPVTVPLLAQVKTLLH